MNARDCGGMDQVFDFAGVDLRALRRQAKNFGKKLFQYFCVCAQGRNGFLSFCRKAEKLVLIFEQKSFLLKASQRLRTTAWSDVEFAGNIRSARITVLVDKCLNRQ